MSRTEEKPLIRHFPQNVRNLLKRGWTGDPHSRESQSPIRKQLFPVPQLPFEAHALRDPKRRDHATLDFVAGIFPSCHRRSRVAIHRNDGPLAFEEMTEAKN